MVLNKRLPRIAAGEVLPNVLPRDLLALSQTKAESHLETFAGAACLTRFPVRQAPQKRERGLSGTCQSGSPPDRFPPLLVWRRIFHLFTSHPLVRDLLIGGPLDRVFQFNDLLSLWVDTEVPGQLTAIFVHLSRLRCNLPGCDGDLTVLRNR
jgi:hypothetical protein